MEVQPQCIPITDRPGQDSGNVAPVVRSTVLVGRLGPVQSDDVPTHPEGRMVRIGLAVEVTERIEGPSRRRAAVPDRGPVACDLEGATRASFDALAQQRIATQAAQGMPNRAHRGSSAIPLGVRRLPTHTGMRQERFDQGRDGCCPVPIEDLCPSHAPIVVQNGLRKHRSGVQVPAIEAAQPVRVGHQKPRRVEHRAMPALGAVRTASGQTRCVAEPELVFVHRLNERRIEGGMVSGHYRGLSVLSGALRRLSFS